jgi:hypothetical protein
VKKSVFYSLIGGVANSIIWAILKTCKITVSNLDYLTTHTDKKRILMLWHNRLVITPQLLHELTPTHIYAAMVSNSRDGELLSKMICHYQKGSVIRVPHDLRHQGLREMIRTLKQSAAIPVITPDGPRGPRYSIKGGVVLAAKGSNALIIPMSWSATRYWEFKTWDRLRLPKPFSTLHVAFGKPVDIAAYSNAEAIDILQQNLHGIS